MLTRTLLFIAQGGGNLAPPPPPGRALPPPETRKLHVFDPDPGAHLRALEPPLAGPMASPMTYLHQGRQYIVVGTGAGLTTALVAYALPTP